ncbi:hypothetical protein EKO27_g11559 [Xylaria grammica]|uniref:Tse2 ADP-ribosyltransferase toxin domain-containing protein n=1 Tax=Xylaria grammica TaxID=363999 RepID=A0A439CMZ8_9PEZI|nr:hypothetical protein EKO27_g11559 [Xylaria grammica]
MIGVAQRFAFRPLFAPSRILRRGFSIKAIYSSFPATLSYYSPRQKVCLYDEREADNRPDNVYYDRVTLENGLVFPRASQNPFISNGAIMFPNTAMMQEIFRRHYDEALDREEGGQEIDTPYIYSVPKGTPIPSHLILVNEFLSQFSLQPAHGMPLEALNEALDEFYSKHARKEEAGSWLGNHPYHLAIDDNVDAKWMSE